jgi:urease accessory protein
MQGLLLLADGRFPTGGHAHSGGVEAAVLAGLVHDVDSLADYLRGRLATAGLVDAAFAAQAASGADLRWLDAESIARTPSPAQRAASRAQAAHLRRAAQAAWPDAEVPAGLTFPVALGAVAAAAGVDPVGAAALACHHAVTGPAGAAVRLLGLDPFAVHGVVAAMGPTIDAVAAEAATRDELPALSGMVPELAADAHAAHPEALFAS